jgi:hypothetical protein
VNRCREQSRFVSAGELYRCIPGQGEQFSHVVRVNVRVRLGGQMGGAAGMMRGLNIPGTSYCPVSIGSVRSILYHICDILCYVVNAERRILAAGYTVLLPRQLLWIPPLPQQ